MSARRRLIRGPRGIVLPALALASIATGTARADSAALDTVPVPDGAARVDLVLDIVRDGRSTSIARLETSASVTDTLAFYRDAWAPSDEDPGHIEDRAGDWSIVSRLTEEALLVVQLREDERGVEALVSAAALAPAGDAGREPPVLPDGARLLSTTSTHEGGRRASTAIVAASARSGEVALFYRDRMVRDGWTLARDAVADGASVLLFDRRGAHLEVVVSEIPGGSVAVVNEVRFDD